MLFTAEEAHVSVACKRGRTESAAVVQKSPAFVDSGICDLGAVASLFVGNETKQHVNQRKHSGETSSLVVNASLDQPRCKMLC